MGRVKQIKQETQFFPKKLIEKLKYIKHYPLTFVEAPSGFGKTSSLRYFFDNEIDHETSVLWHTFSGESLKNSWKYFCSLINEFDTESSNQLIATGLPDKETLPLLKKIFRNINCNQETYIVLDDFMAWDLPESGKFLMALSEHREKKLHIVVASQILSREEHDEIIESSRFYLLQESALIFSRDDIDAYYRQAGLALNSVQLNELSVITEGWIMALYLQMLSFIENGKFHKGSMDNLIHKALWNKLDDIEKIFLLSLSIFTRFSLIQATAFSKLSSAQTELILKDKRVFVNYDKEERMYYFHSLFHSFLKEQFELLPIEKQREIYLIGGDVANKAGDRLNTLRFYYLSTVWEKFLSLPLTSYEIADISDEISKPMIIDILKNTPFETKCKYPMSVVPLAFTLFFLNEKAMLISMKDEIYQIIEKSYIDKSKKDILLGETELLLSFLEFNRIDSMSIRHRRAIELLKGPTNLINIKSSWTFGSPSIFCLYHREVGGLDKEISQMDECMPIYYELASGHGTGAEDIMRAEAHFMRGEIEEAQIVCHRALINADNKGQNSIYQCGLFLLAQIAILQGDQNKLQDFLVKFEECSRQNTEDLCRYTLAMSKAYLNLLLGKTDEIAPWIAEGDINDRRMVIMIQPFAYIIYCRYLLNKKEYLKLIGACQHMLAISSIFPNILSQIYAKIYMTFAFNATGKQEKAIDSLKSAIEMAMPDGIYIPFAENYKGISKLLSKILVLDKTNFNNIAHLSEKLADSIDKLTKSSELESYLTPKEKEIIKMIKKGLKNTEIATEMFISVNTVKTHIKQIYNKLGISSKTQLIMLEIKDI